MSWKRPFAVGLCAAAVVLWASQKRGYVTDFDQLWYGARALWLRADPYSVVGPGRLFPYAFPLYYPANALVVFGPFALFPLAVARALFVGTGLALFAVGLERRRRPTLPFLVSLPLLATLLYVPIVPWMAVGLLIPALAVLWPAKPNIGALLAVGAGKRQWSIALLAGLAAVAIAFALRPDWLTRWREIVTTSAQANHRPYLVRPFGWLLLLAVARWRDCRARILLVLALTPMAHSLPEPLLLFALPWSRWQAWALALLSWGMYPALGFTVRMPHAEVDARLSALSLWCQYLPALVMVLMSGRRHHRDRESIDVAVVVAARDLDHPHRDADRAHPGA